MFTGSRNPLAFFRDISLGYLITRVGLPVAHGDRHRIVRGVVETGDLTTQVDYERHSAENWRFL